MAAMKAFYGKTLDLGIKDERADRFTVEAGETRITFTHEAQTVDGRAPFYHLAFNIPENKIVPALEWQKVRTPLLPIPERNRAAGLPPEVVDDSHWNAHSIFFLDPAGKVLEYIARHDLKNGARVYPTAGSVRGAKAARHQRAGSPHHIAIEERCSCA
jgi:catechol-2,3-dioxygenase